MPPPPPCAPTPTYTDRRFGRSWFLRLTGVREREEEEESKK